MSKYVPAWCLIAAVLVFAPVGYRVLSWQRQQTPTYDVSDVQAGEVLFNHEWQANDPLSGGGDGLGPVFNAKSCVACHNQSGVGGAGGVEHNVTTYLVTAPDGAPLREGVVHAFATSERYRETLKHVDPSFPPISQPRLEQIVAIAGPLPGGRSGTSVLTFPSNVRLSQRNTPSLFGAGLIDSIPDRVIIAMERQQRVRHGLAGSGSESVPVGRAMRLAQGQVGRFGWKAHTAHLSDFVQAACANELGLGNPGREQPVSMADALYKAKGQDLTQQQCDQLTAFVAALPRPTERPHADGIQQAQAVRGKALFATIGCASCHTPNLGAVEGIYSDLLLHRMGPTLEGGSAYYGVVTPTPTPTTPTSPPTDSMSSRPLADEWRTPPLWGIADSAPYLHDGRAASLAEAIAMHGGQGASSSLRFQGLSEGERQDVVAFLRTLRAP